MSFFSELKRRNVFRMGIAYIVVAWVLLQAIDFGLDIISAPNWVMQVFFLASIVGLPVVLIFAWVFEMTPEGLKRESEVDRAQSDTHSTGRKLDRTIITFLALAVVLLLVERFITQDDIPVLVSTAEVAVEKPEVTDEAGDNSLRSVAVLPFVNMSSDPEQEYFSDGLSEELLNRLAQNDRLRVAARTSSFQFKGKNQDISDIGSQLNVDHVLEGSVRKAANRLRITAQLIEVDTGFHLWSETYEREINDIFAIQDDISLAISKALEAELGAVDKIGNHPTDSLEAYQLYLEARFLLAKRGEANMLKANVLFRQATALDPGFSEAWSGLAYNYSLLPAYGPSVSTQQAWETIEIAAGKAIEIDPGNAEAYVALARGNYYDDLEEIRSHFERAYELAPNNADVVNLYGDFMTETGNFQFAELLEQKAIELDPLAAVHHSDMAFILYTLGRYEEGLEYARTSARLVPDLVDRSDPLILGLALTGQYTELKQVIRRFENLPGSSAEYINAWWCMLYYQQADVEKLRQKVAERLQNTDAQSGAWGYTLTAFYTAWLDGIDAALPLLAKAFEKQEWLLTWPEYFYLPEQISNDPEWLEFWQHPRLAELMELRRGYNPGKRFGYWKERPKQ